jgi:hypothetical protein
LRKERHTLEKKRTSLSKLVEKYIDKLTEVSATEIEISPFVKSLSLPAKNKHWNHKKAKARYLAKKYK